MKIAGLLVIAFTAVMLLIHVSTSKILKEWHKPDDSWVKRRFPPHRILEVEALYWALCLALWPLWPSLSSKVMVVVFAVIHLGSWLASELHIIRLNVGGVVSAQTRKAYRFVIAFDLVEAAALVAIGWLAVLYVWRSA